MTRASTDLDFEATTERIWELEGDVENQSAFGSTDTGPTGRREKIWQLSLAARVPYELYELASVSIRGGGEGEGGVNVSGFPRGKLKGKK